MFSTSFIVVSCILVMALEECSYQHGKVLVSFHSTAPNRCGVFFFFSFFGSP